MLTTGTARGALAAASTCVVVALALAACSAPSGQTISSGTSGSGFSDLTSEPAPPTTGAPTTGAPSSSTTGRSTPTDPAGTRTVYAGPSRTSTLVPWDEPSVRSGGGPTPSAPAGAADLTIVLDDGFGIRATWTLTCGPPGGNHPHPKIACGVLGANGAKALPASKGVCDQQYGGPQKALVTGTWRGRAVRSQFTLENGCEIARWTDMIGLLPPGGV